MTGVPQISGEGAGLGAEHGPSPEDLQHAWAILTKLAEDSGAMWNTGAWSFAIDAFIDITPGERDLLDRLKAAAIEAES